MPANTHELLKYGGSYFSFVVVGVSFSGLLFIFQNGLPASLQNAQSAGTLEAIFTTQATIWQFMMGSSAYSFLFSSISSVIYLSIGSIVFGVRLTKVNFLSAAIIFALGAACYISMGLISSGFVLIFKRGNPLDWFLSAFSGIVGGIVYPTTLLPAFLRTISKLIPITYTLEGLRKSLLLSAGLKEIMPQIIPLLMLVLILAPISIIFLSYSMRKARRDGSLAHF